MAAGAQLPAWERRVLNELQALPLQEKGLWLQQRIRRDMPWEQMRPLAAQPNQALWPPSQVKDLLRGNSQHAAVNRAITFGWFRFGWTHPPGTFAGSGGGCGNAQCCFVPPPPPGATGGSAAISAAQVHGAMATATAKATPPASGSEGWSDPEDPDFSGDDADPAASVSSSRPLGDVSDRQWWFARAGFWAVFDYLARQRGILLPAAASSSAAASTLPPPYTAPSQPPPPPPYMAHSLPPSAAQPARPPPFGVLLCVCVKNFRFLSMARTCSHAVVLRRSSEQHPVCEGPRQSCYGGALASAGRACARRRIAAIGTAHDRISPSTSTAAAACRIPGACFTRHGGFLWCA